MSTHNIKVNKCCDRGLCLDKNINNIIFSSKERPNKSNVRLLNCYLAIPRGKL